MGAFPSKDGCSSSSPSRSSGAGCCACACWWPSPPDNCCSHHRRRDHDCYSEPSTSPNPLTFPSPSPCTLCAALCAPSLSSSSCLRSDRCPCAGGAVPHWHSSCLCSRERSAHSVSFQHSSYCSDGSPAASRHHVLASRGRCPFPCRDRRRGSALDRGARGRWGRRGDEPVLRRTGAC